MGRVYHLWRRYQAEPRLRYAVSVERADTEDGYRVVDHDPVVADPHFMGTLVDTLAAPTMLRGSARPDENTIGETLRWAHHGDEGHFETAIRMVPEAVLRGAGRLG